ncbi:MAG: YdbH domain-containing protein [Alphaproteobacteria bacterium]
MAKGKRGRAALRFGLAALGFAALVALAVAFALPGLAERRLLDALSAAGIDHAELSVRRIGWRSAEIGDVRLGAAGALTVSRIEVFYEPADLAAGRLARVDATGLRLRVAIDANGVSLGGLDPLLATGAGPGREIPVGAVSLDDVVVEIATPAGPLTVTSRAIAITKGDDGGLEAAAGVVMATTAASVSGRLTVRISPGGELEATFALADGHAKFGKAVASGLGGRIDAQGSSGALERFEAHLTADETALPGLTLRGATLDLSYGDDRLTAAFVSRSADDALRIGGEARIEGLGGAPRFALDAEIAATDPRAFGEALPPLPATAGRGRVRVSASGTLPAIAQMPIRDALAAAEAAGRLALDFDGIDIPDAATGLAVSGAIAFDLAAGALTLTSDESVRLAATRLDPALFDALGLPPDTRPAFSGPVTFDIGGAGRMPPFVYLTSDDGAVSAYVNAEARLVAEGGARVDAGIEASADFDPAGTLGEFVVSRLDLAAHGIEIAGTAVAVDSLRLDLAGAPAAFEGGFELRLASDAAAVSPLAASDVQIDLAGDVAFDDRRLTVTARSGRLSVGDFRLADSFAARAPVELRLAPGTEPLLEATFAAGGGGVLRHRARLSLAPLRGVLTVEERTTEVAVEAAGIEIDGESAWPAGTYAGRVGLRDGRFALPAYEFAAEGVAATLRFGASDAEDGPLAELTVGTLRHTGTPALVTPLALDGRIARDGGTLAFELHATAAGDRAAFDVSGYHDLSTATGRAAFTFPHLRFAPGDLQPAELSPALKEKKVSLDGEVAAEGELAWNDAGLTGGATVLIDDVSGEIDRLRFEHVNAVLRLDNLWPPSTPPDQEVAIGLLDPGLPLTDGVIAFHLAPEGRIEVERSEWHWAGGTICGGALTIDPATTRYDVTFEVSDIDMAQIAELAEIDGLVADGRLGGRVPVSASADGVVIHGGRLDAAPGGGALRYTPDAIPPALRQGGEAATLMLNALENFHYESLYITLDRSAEGEAMAGLHLRGSNPAFYDGYPVEFNLTISGALDAMLERGLEGYRVPDSIRKRLQQFGG